MDAIVRLADGIEEVDELLAEEILEPNPDRDDWVGARARVRFLHEALTQKVFAAAADA